MRISNLIALVVISIALTTGCGGSGDEAAPGESDGEPTRSSVNPVVVLMKVPNCTLAPGVEVGEPDINGNMYASCEIEDLEYGEGEDAYTASANVTVRAVDPDDIEAFGYEDASPDDSHKVIFGDGFYLTIVADPAVFGTGALKVEEIAATVGGEVA